MYKIEDNVVTKSKTIHRLLLTASCVFAPLIVAQTDDRRNDKATVVYIVRHAEKTAETPDADLSDAGKRRADVLKWMVRDIEFDAVYSTDAPRTVHTVEPIAKENGLTVEYYVPRPGSLAKTILRLVSGRTILVGGHSNTIPVLLNSLGVPIEDKILPGYDDLFIVTLGNDTANAENVTLQRLHYPGRR